MKKTINLMILAFVTTLFGCHGTLDKSGPYAGDQILYSADQTIATAYDALDTFVHWEKANQKNVSPNIHDAAEEIRRSAPEWFKTAMNLRKAYVADPSPENRLKLANALGVLRVALSEVTGYMIEHSASTTALPHRMASSAV